MCFVGWVGMNVKPITNVQTFIFSYRNVEALAL